jgi:hypothetical protein
LLFLNIDFLNIPLRGGGQNNQDPGPELPSSFTPYFDCVKLLFQSDINISPDRESLSDSKYRLYTVSIGTKKRQPFGLPFFGGGVGLINNKFRI